MPSLGGDQKSTALAIDPVVSANTRKVSILLKSVLFSGGLAETSYSVDARTLQSELGITSPAEPLPSHSTEENAFLSALMEGPVGATADSALVRALIKRLDRSVPAHVHSLQMSLQELASTLVCGIFAVFLKHARAGTNLVRLAIQTARATDVSTPPDRLLQKLWIRASQIKGLLREKKGSGADVELFAEHVMAKMELLLSLSSPPRMCMLVRRPPSSLAFNFLD